MDMEYVYHIKIDVIIGLTCPPDDPEFLDSVLENTAERVRLEPSSSMSATLEETRSLEGPGPHQARPVNPMQVLLTEAVTAFPHDKDTPINGADITDWFTEWQARVIATLAEVGKTDGDTSPASHIRRHRSETTGGNVQVDYLDLVNGLCIAINQDGAWLYPNREEAEKGGTSLDFMGFEQGDPEKHP